MTLESDVLSVPTDPGRPVSRFALSVLLLALLALFLAALAGFGVRLDLWSGERGLALLRESLWAGVSLTILAAVALFAARPGGPRRGFTAAFCGLVLALVVVGLSLQLRRAEARLPRIHDVTTDVSNPPPFVALAPLRAASGNASEYAGETFARAQEVAYQDVQPVLLNLSHYDAYLLVLSTAEEMGWTIIDATEREGRVEATDRTTWFGFREDIVVRLTAVGGRTVVDVRSASRNRQADLGSNARRIRTFLDRLAA